MLPNLWISSRFPPVTPPNSSTFLAEGGDNPSMARLAALLANLCSLRAPPAASLFEALPLWARHVLVYQGPRKPWGGQHFNRPASRVELCLAARYPVLEVPLEGEGEESFKGCVCVWRRLCEALRVSPGVLAIKSLNAGRSRLWLPSQGAADFFQPSSGQRCSISGAVPRSWGWLSPKRGWMRASRGEVPVLRFSFVGRAAPRAPAGPGGDKQLSWSLQHLSTAGCTTGPAQSGFACVASTRRGEVRRWRGGGEGSGGSELGIWRGYGKGAGAGSARSYQGEKGTEGRKSRREGVGVGSDGGILQRSPRGGPAGRARWRSLQRNRWLCVAVLPPRRWWVSRPSRLRALLASPGPCS